MMTKLTPFFNRSEFQCKGKNCDGHGNNCGGDTVDVELMKVLNLLRLHFNQPVKITSGYRCSTHNKQIKGGLTSKHMQGKAADIKVTDTTPATVYRYLCEMYPDKYGIGRYKTWVHIDVRAEKARWVK